MTEHILGGLFLFLIVNKFILIPMLERMWLNSMRKAYRTSKELPEPTK